jgi:hypothetical protein
MNLTDLGGQDLAGWAMIGVLTQDVESHFTFGAKVAIMAD